MSHPRITTTALAVAAILFASETAAQRQLSGSELLRAERCAGLYDCDEDGSWATADFDRSTLKAAGRSVHLSRECAELVVQTFALIEDRGPHDNTRPDGLANAGQLLLSARHACHGGQFAEAVAQYRASRRELTADAR
jgi:hypothetical protein